MAEPPAPGSATGTFLGPACCPPPSLPPLACQPHSLSLSGRESSFRLQSILYTPLHPAQTLYLPFNRSFYPSPSSFLVLYLILLIPADITESSNSPCSFPPVPLCLLQAPPRRPFLACRTPNYVSFSAVCLSSMPFVSLYFISSSFYIHFWLLLHPFFSLSYSLSFF